MKFYLVKLLTNDKGQDASSVSVFDTYEKALIAYHQILASFHNASDVLHAVVQITNYVGNVQIMEIVDHTPAPEPEPEVETQTEE